MPYFEGSVQRGLFVIGNWGEYLDPIGGRDSSVDIVTRLRAGRSRDRIPVVARFSIPVQTGPIAHPASHAMGNRVMIEGKGAWAWRLPPNFI